MANVLVVYASQNGQTRKIAERIATGLRVRRHLVELLDAESLPQDLDLSRFQAVFVGSPIIANGYLRPIVRFVQEYRAALQRIPTLFFSVGLALLSKVSDGRAQTMEIVDKFIARTGWRPRRIELVAGSLPYTKYGFLTRFLMRRIVRKEGGETDTSRDYEYTDFDAVDRFAMGFVEEVTATRAPEVMVVAPPGPTAPEARA
ncbi:MAG TPA: flavodoxin domain-containing protein [Myxococcaceae bacterium]|nr:flavodoxin domain-containing protein [Myxococcaceae bacterium]